MDNMETAINLSLLSFAGLAFVVFLVYLETMPEHTRRKLLESIRAESLGAESLGAERLEKDAQNTSHASGT